MSDLTGIGPFLSKLRTSTGLTQTEVAHRMGTDPSCIGRLERGERDIRVSTLLRYLRAVGFRISFKREEAL